MISMLEISDEEHQRIRDASIAQANAIEAAAKKMSPQAALDLMLSPRGLSVMSRFLAIAFWAHDRLPRHRQTPSDAAAVATIFFSLFRCWASSELQQVFEQAGIDRHLKQDVVVPSKAKTPPRTSRRSPPNNGCGVRRGKRIGARQQFP